MILMNHAITKQPLPYSPFYGVFETLPVIAGFRVKAVKGEFLTATDGRRKFVVSQSHSHYRLDTFERTDYGVRVNGCRSIAIRKA